MVYLGKLCFIVLFINLLFSFNFVFSQEKIDDSCSQLKKEFESIKDKIKEIKKVVTKDPNCNQALIEIEKLLKSHASLPKLEYCNLLDCKFIIASKQNNHIEAEKLFFEIKDFAIKNKLDKFDLGGLYMRVASIYNATGRSKEALENYYASIDWYKLDSGNKDKYNNIITAHFNIGVLYSNLNEHRKSIIENNKALSLKNSNTNKKTLAYIYNGLAGSYGEIDSIKLGKENALIAIEIFNELKDVEGVAMAKQNLASIYQKEGDFVKLEKIYNELEIYFNSGDDVFGRAYFNLNNGIVLRDRGKYDKAISVIKKGLVDFESLPDTFGIKNSYLILYDVFKLKGDMTKALEYHEKYAELSDRIINKENIEQLTTVQNNYVFELEKEKIANENTLKIEKEKTFQKYLAFGLLLLSGLLFFAFRAYRIKKKTAETISNQKDEIEKYSQINENLIFSLSHDIKEPMLGVQLLLNKIKSEDAYLQKAAISIGEQVGSINSIVNNLLQLKKASSSNDTEISSPSEIKETVAKVTQALSYRISERSIQIINQLSDSDTLKLSISNKKLYLVALNLISNAIKYSPEGGKIEIYANAQGLFIRDYGDGIDPAILDKIGKEHIDKKDNGSGSGMGLMLISNLLLGSGLKLHFENAVGGGTLAGLKLG